MEGGLLVNLREKKINSTDKNTDPENRRAAAEKVERKEKAIRGGGRHKNTGRTVAQSNLCTTVPKFSVEDGYKTG